MPLQRSSNTNIVPFLSFYVATNRSNKSKKCILLDFPLVSKSKIRLWLMWVLYNDVYIYIYSGGTQHKSFAQNRNFHNITLVRLVWEMCIFNLIYYHDRLVSYFTLLHKNFAKFIFLSCTIFTYFANIRSTHKLNLFTTLFIFWLCYCSTVCWAHLSINVTLTIFQNSIKLLILFAYSTFDSIEKIFQM